MDTLGIGHFKTSQGNGKGVIPTDAECWLGAGENPNVRKS